MIDYKALYAFKFADEKDYENLAMYVQEHGDELWFFQPDRDHGFKGKVTRERKDGFTFLSEEFEPGEWDFKLLTYEHFRDKFYQCICNGKQIADSVHSTEDLWEWYRKTYPRD